MGASDEEPSKGFKVQDRRRFSAEGELRPEFRGSGETASPPPGESEPAGAHEPERSAEKTGGVTASSADSRMQSAPPAEITFATFLMSLSTEALVHLGEMPDPASGEHRHDLAMAQHLIDILGLLRDKTRGNLDQNEQGLLDAILFDLRMKYVEIARRAG
jgi:hypothetical protein